MVGGKNVGNRTIAKVVTVRLGSPADLQTSVKPGELTGVTLGNTNSVAR